MQGHSINQRNKKVWVLQVTGMEGPESSVTVLIPKKSLKTRRGQRKLSGRFFGVACLRHSTSKTTLVHIDYGSIIPGGGGTRRMGDKEAGSQGRDQGYKCGVSPASWGEGCGSNPRPHPDSPCLPKPACRLRPAPVPQSRPRLTQGPPAFQSPAQATFFP